MSTIVMPDPHPGRCKNYRTDGDEWLRCLDYERAEHVCSFPTPRPKVQASTSYTSTAVLPVPKPWVKP